MADCRGENIYHRRRRLSSTAAIALFGAPLLEVESTDSALILIAGTTGRCHFFLGGGGVGRKGGRDFDRVTSPPPPPKERFYSLPSLLPMSMKLILKTNICFLSG